jgi:diaminopimelate decarboxylase
VIDLSDPNEHNRTDGIGRTGPAQESPENVLPVELLSDGATIGPDGRLAIAGLDLIDLADEFGTPLFVYDEDQLRERCRKAVAAFGPGVAYATKAFLCKAMASLAYEEGMNLDVATGGELFVARSAGVPAGKLVLHGNNKSLDELRYGLREGVGRVVIDSFDEIDRLERLFAEGLGPVRALVRITPGVEAHTHQFLSTGQEDTKFGFTVSTGAAGAAVERLSASLAVELLGIHVHIGSQIFRVDSFLRAVETVAEFSVPLGLPELCFGGGLGVAYVEGEHAPTVTEWGTAIRDACAAAGITARVTAEPGRAIVAAAAVTLYRVGTVKELPGIRTYISVDGGMSDNPRPVLYGSGYEAFLPRATLADRPKRATVVGKHCESGDVLVHDARVPDDLQVGDVLGVPVTGAYGHSMGSNYNKVLRPAVVFVRKGKARLVVRRQTHDDLILQDL